MKYSKMFAKTQKNFKECDSVNATLLQKGGFIDQVMSGVYTFLPLGLRVLNKVEDIVREEMDKIGSEVFMPSLSPKELWERTDRLGTVDVLIKTSGANETSIKKNDSEYILNPTHEEVVTPLVHKFNVSYKDLPIAVYQIQSKFRNEARAKSGLLRGREFRMKDLYSFHTSEEDLKRFYDVAKEAYWKVFERLSIKDDTYFALASGGDFTKDYSHEFQTACETGEDVLFHAPSINITYNKEVAPSLAPVWDNDGEELLQREDILGEGIIGVAELVKFLNIEIERTTKTLLYEDNEGNVIAAAVRGDYEINEYKLEKVSGRKGLRLASPETVERATGAKIGYLGILNLPKEVTLFCDDSIANRKNFECGANKTNYHAVNINFGRDLPLPEKFYDLKMAKEGDRYPQTEEVYKVFNASEVGNIFPLNTKFSKAFDYYFTDADGSRKLVYMGCYGIGTSRLMGILVEKFHDDKGIIWPKAVAPFQVHILSLGEDAAVMKKAMDLYDQLTNQGIEVLWDDREGITPGEKFADSDLIGIPLKVIIGKKSVESATYECKERKTGETKQMSVEEIVAYC